MKSFFHSVVVAGYIQEANISNEYIIPEHLIIVNSHPNNQVFRFVKSQKYNFGTLTSVFTYFKNLLVRENPVYQIQHTLYDKKITTKKRKVYIKIFSTLSNILTVVNEAHRKKYLTFHQPIKETKPKNSLFNLLGKK